MEETMTTKDILLMARMADDVKIPTKRAGDSCFDIYAHFEEHDMVIQPHETVMVPTGLMCAFAPDYVMILKERGSTGTKGIGQRSGVVDSNYRGEIFVPITNHNDKPLLITKETNAGTLDILRDDYIVYPYSKAISQALVLPVAPVEVKEVCPEMIAGLTTERGNGALGSSGK